MAQEYNSMIMFDFPGCHLHFSRSLFCGRILSLLGSSCRPERWSLSVTLLRFVTIHLCKGMIMFGKRVQEYDYVWYPRLPPVLLQEPLLRQDQRQPVEDECKQICLDWIWGNRSLSVMFCKKGEKTSETTEWKPSKNLYIFIYSLLLLWKARGPWLLLDWAPWGSQSSSWFCPNLMRDISNNIKQLYRH